MNSFIVVAFLAMVAVANAGFLHSAPAVYAHAPAVYAAPILKATYPTYAVHSPIVSSYHAHAAPLYGGLGYAGYGYAAPYAYSHGYGHGGHGLGYYGGLYGK